MKINVTFSMFHDAVSPLDPTFTYDGLRTIYDHIVEIEADAGHEQNLDAQTIADSYNEYPTAKEALEKDSPDDYDASFTEDECYEKMNNLGIVWRLSSGRILTNPC